MTTSSTLQHILQYPSTTCVQPLPCLPFLIFSPESFDPPPPILLLPHILAFLPFFPAFAIPPMPFGNTFITIPLFVLSLLCLLLPSACHAQSSYLSPPMKQHQPPIPPNLLIRRKLLSSPRANATAHTNLHHTSQNSTSLSSHSSVHSQQHSKTHAGHQNPSLHAQHNNHPPKTISNINSLSNHQRIVKIAKLLQHSRNLHQDILEKRQQNERATALFQRSLRRLSSLSADRAAVQKSLHAITRKLKEYRRQAPLYDRTLSILNKQAGAAILEIDRLRTSKYSVMHEKALLQDHFRHRGLGAWVQKYIKGAVNPLVAGAVVEGTANVVEPVLDGIERLAEVNEDLAKIMADQLSYSVPVVEKPFYSGFVTYAVLLLPLVLVTSILLKIKRGLRKFSIGHFIILGNFYFTLLSGGCFIATILGRVDVLLTFRHTNLGMFDLVMVLHGVLYLAHVSLHVLMTVSSRDKSLGLHTFLLALVGSHFFLHSYLHAMHNEDPHVDKRAYAIYTGVFAYVLYTWTVKHIRMSMEKNSMKLKNKSFIPSNDQESSLPLADYGSAIFQISPNKFDSVVTDTGYILPADDKSRLESRLRHEIRVERVFNWTPVFLENAGLLLE